MEKLVLNWLLQDLAWLVKADEEQERVVRSARLVRYSLAALDLVAGQLLSRRLHRDIPDW